MRLIYVLLFLIIATNILFRLLPEQYEEGSIDVFFCPNCLENYTALLTGKEQCLFYDLNEPRVIELVDDVHIFEKDIPSKGLMHHKFCLMGDTILTGSTNPTTYGLTRNDNNVLLITSATLAKRYREEYQEIITRTSKKYKKTPRRTAVNVSGTYIELYMCPQDNCEDAVLRTLQKASSVQFMIFTFTSDAIGDVLVQLHEQGVPVSGIFEKRQNSKYSEYKKLLAWGIPVILDANPGTMHHKVFIVDEEIVITGSYNPTASANERNDENLLIIHDKDIASKYLQEFERVKTY